MNRFSLTLLFGICVGTAESTCAAALFSQTSPSEPSRAFSSQDTTSMQIVADNFMLTGNSPATVRSLRLIGGRINDAIPEPADDFRVVFLEDSGGLPGEAIPSADFDSNLQIQATATGGELLNGRRSPVEYQIDLGIGISLTPNTEYWIAVTNDPGPGFGWVWARAERTLDAKLSSVNSDSGSFANLPWVRTASGGGMWFELSDQNIPEPTSGLLLVVGLTPTALRRNRSRCLT